MKFNYKPNVSEKEFRELDKIRPRRGRKVNTPDARMFTVDGFLNKKQCRRLIRIIDDHNQPSPTIGANNGYRTSRTCWFQSLKGADREFVRRIDRRICNELGIEAERSEAFQGQVYSKGDEFKAHHDYFYDNPQHLRETRVGTEGQRTWTFMIYLNTVKRGGVTEFPRISRSFLPRQGMALAWNNLTSDGEYNSYTEHSGKRVGRGKKYIITKWFRTRGALKSQFVSKTRI